MLRGFEGLVNTAIQTERSTVSGQMVRCVAHPDVGELRMGARSTPGDTSTSKTCQVGVKVLQTTAQVIY